MNPSMFPLLLPRQAMKSFAWVSRERDSLSRE